MKQLKKIRIGKFGKCNWKGFLLCAIFSLLGMDQSLSQTLSATDVQRIFDQASTRARDVSPDSLIAVVDREGNVLGVWDTNPATVPTQLEIGSAISKAGTACFLDSNQNALTTRTVSFIVQENFPPGVNNTNNGPLIGVNNSHLPFSDVNRFRGPPFPAVPAFPAVAPALGPPILNTSLSGFAGGLPLYKGSVLVGGVGVFGDGNDEITPQAVFAPDVDEDVALAGQIGFEPPAFIRANRIFFDGLSLPYVTSNTQFTTSNPVGAALAAFPVTASPLPAGYPFVPIYPTDTFAGVTGEVRNPIVGDTANPNLVNPLTQQEVRNIINEAVKRALITRSRVRLPRGSAASVYIAVVNNPNQPNSTNAPAQILGVFRMPDAVARSWDISVQKARTCVFFSSSSFAFSTRSVGYLCQARFPPGIVDTEPGPLFGLQGAISPTTQLVPLNQNLPNGITIFPGGHPIYKGNELVGAIGISGDGIDEDDIIAAAGSVAMRSDGQGRMTAPKDIRADRFSYRGARLPFAKFPRQPVR